MTEAAAATPPPRRWPRRLGIALAVLLLLAALVTWALPAALSALIRHQLPPRLTELLGRPVSVGAVQVQPWQLALSLDDLRIGAAPGAASAPVAPGAVTEPQFQLGRVAVVLSAASLRHRAPVVESLSLQSPRLRLTRTGPGHYDIDDILQRLARPAAPDAAASTEPARFALYNLRLDDGQITLEDRPLGRTHRITALSLGLPFLSNLPAHVEVHTEPRLRLTLNGTAIDSGGQAKPFAQTRQARLNLSFAQMDLAPWLGYVPEGLPLRLASGRLSSQLDLVFEQAPQGEPRVLLQGRLGLDDMALQARDGAPLAGWRSLALELRELQPLSRQVALGMLRIEGPRLTVARGADGRVNWQRLGDAPATAAGTPPAASASAPGATASRAAQPPDASPWRVSLDSLRLVDGHIDWHDATLRHAANRWQLADLAVQAGPLQWPSPTPAPLTLATELRQGSSAPGRLTLDGRASDREAAATLKLDGLSLDAIAPYLAPVLVPRLTGRLSAQVALDWAADASAPRLGVTLADARLDDLALRPPQVRGQRSAAPLAGWKQLRLQNARIDLLARRVALERLSLAQPRLTLVRAQDGALNVAQWLAASPPQAATQRAPAARPSTKAPTPRQTAAAAPARTRTPAPWQLTLGELAVDGGRLQFTDLGVHDAPGEPLRLDLAQLRVRLRQAQWPLAPRQAPWPLQLEARIGVPGSAQAGAAAAGNKPMAAPAGTLHWAGRVSPAPLLAEGRLQLRHLPLHLAERYATAAMGPLTLLRAEGNLQGRLAVRQQGADWRVDTQGDLRIADLQLHTRPEAGGRLDTASELLSWQALDLNGLHFTMAPGSKPRLVVADAALTDFYSRLVITEDGRFNLRDVAARPAAAGASSPGAAAPSQAPASAPAPASTAPAASPASSPAADPLPIDLELGGTRLVNGRIDFTDRFIRPNYSARLSELNGRLGALRSGTREMATLSLTGRAADTAMLEISGQLNPTAQPLALDIRARATDLELAPLSPYAGKYAGYAIERGKLSMDVSYKIDPDGKLDAKNQVILNQLTFGDRVESPDATKLPVRLAIALLKDRHGVIDINLPVSGSVSDPQFSVGGIVWKVILNLLGRALTAPFSLLTGGSGPDISQVAFDPGTARIADASAAVIDKVAQALVDRPALTMTVTGTADPASEREAWQAATLEARLQAERRRAQLRAGAATAAAPAASGVPAAAEPLLSGDERTRLLRDLYRNTALPDRPRNLVGLLKELPPAEMEARLKASLLPSTDLMRELALQRGLAVRDALVAKGLPASRLFLAAPLLRASAEDDAAWVPRVTLTLALP